MIDIENQAIALDLVINGPDQIAQASAAVDAALSTLWPDTVIANRMTLAVHEAIVNAVRHGNRGIPLATAEITLRVIGDELVVEISDQGPGFDPAQVPNPRLPAALRLPHGRGVLLMRTAMDSMSVTTSPAGRFVVTLRTVLPAGSTNTTARRTPMNVETRVIDGVTVVDLSGKLTIGVGDVKLREAVQGLLTDGRKKIVMNLSGVTVIDSSGLGVLVGSYTSATRSDALLKLSDVPPKVRDILHITQLSTVFETFDSESDAVASFA
ncbi:anti-sigma factor antagonist [Nocardia sp. IBHARD005]|uniref:anti-sigma factor antagonist n=1 Tax=Nocardia sp. IBHARD005 TaxID=3457765 RepID=UPI004057D2D1